MIVVKDTAFGYVVSYPELQQSARVLVANTRNLVKRIARELFRRHRESLPALDMVVRLQAPVAKATRAELNQDLLALLHKLPRQ